MNCAASRATARGARRAASATTGSAKSTSFSPSPTPDDVLLTLVWHAGLGASLLRALDVDRASLAVALARAGLAVPPGEAEPLGLRPRTRVGVPYERLGELLRVLPARLPGGSRFGFDLHHETRRAWIVVDEKVDAERLVEEVFAGRPDGASVAGE